MNTAETLLLASLAVPLATGAGVVLARHRPNPREAVSLLGAAALFGVVVLLAGQGLAPAATRLHLWTLLPGLSLALAVEPLGLVFALLASGLWFLTTVYSIGYLRAKKEEHQTRFYLFFALALTATMGIAAAGNLFTLFVFYELLTLSTYPLVTHIGNRAAIEGGRTYLTVLIGTSIGLLLPAILLTWHWAGTLDFVAGGILAGRVTSAQAGLLLALFVLGVGKAAIMPMHRWLPAAMVAPSPVSALLHAVAVVKAGAFTLIKVVLYVFGTGFLATVPAERLLLWLAGGTVVVASLVALRQDNLKRLLAYSTIGQLATIVLAALCLSPSAEIGASLHLVMHALGKITLFFAAGAIYVAAGKTQVSELDGIGRRMPYTLAAFALGALTMIGLPPAGGFVSKWYILSGALQADQWFVLAVLLASTALNAGYFLPIIHRAFFRAESHAPRHAHGEAPGPMLGALVGTAVLSVLLFFYHAPLVRWLVARLGVGA